MSHQLCPLKSDCEQNTEILREKEARSSSRTEINKNRELRQIYTSRSDLLYMRVDGRKEQFSFTECCS